MHYVQAKSILSPKNGINIYRGCTHGCIYCDSRSVCYGMTHDFEDVEIKQNAPELLESALQRKRVRSMIGTGSMCDPYQPIEVTERLTRRCLEVIARYGFGLSVQTKSDLILRDLDLLKKIHAQSKCVVQMTLTTCDEALCRLIEPHVATTKRRFEVLMQMKREGIPTVVWLCPLLPFLSDTEENLRGILDYCFEAGVQGVLAFGAGMTLRDGNREYYYQCLSRHFPGLREKYAATFAGRYECASPDSARLMRLLETSCRARGVLYGPDEIFGYLHEFSDRRAGEQLSLF